MRKDTPIYHLREKNYLSGQSDESPRARTPWRRTRMTSDYSNCSGQRRDKQGPLSRGSRTVKTPSDMPRISGELTI